MPFHPGYWHPPSSPPGFSTCLSSLPLQRVSPSAEMVMIDRMFIQEEKTTLALDKQLAKEKPGERGGGERGTKGVPAPSQAPELDLGAGAVASPSSTARRRPSPAVLQ